MSWHWQIFRNEAIFQVRDRVPGVDPEVLLQAFAPFYTQRPGGTGLGLAIAKKIILDYRGSLWVLGRNTVRLRSPRLRRPP
ncbi:ATP-binding protein [Nostoc sp.]